MITNDPLSQNFNPHSRKGSASPPGSMSLSCNGISIHTPARGVTQRETYICFLRKISIHTPARGVTMLFLLLMMVGLYFNPHSRKGSDQGAEMLCYAKNNFNPHSRKGSDSYVVDQDGNVADFNPHSRKGSDRALWSAGINNQISIHTPARGVTMSTFTTATSMERFQSTLPQGE